MWWVGGVTAFGCPPPGLMDGALSQVPWFPAATGPTGPESVRATVRAGMPLWTGRRSQSLRRACPGLGSRAGRGAPWEKVRQAGGPGEGRHVLEVLWASPLPHTRLFLEGNVVWPGPPSSGPGGLRGSRHLASPEWGLVGWDPSPVIAPHGG